MKHFAIFMSLDTGAFWLSSHRFKNEKEAIKWGDQTDSELYGLVPYPSKSQIKRMIEESNERRNTKKKVTKISSKVS